MAIILYPDRLIDLPEYCPVPPYVVKRSGHTVSHEDPARRQLIDIQPLSIPGRLTGSVTTIDC